MTTERKSSFRGVVSGEARERKNAKSSYGYLQLPKGVKVYNVDPNTRKVLLDFIPYEVTDTHHPDRNDDIPRAVPGSLWYKRPFKIHRNVGGANDSVVCLTSVGKRCPICEYQKKRLKEGADKEELNQLRAKERNLYIVIPLDSKKHDSVPHIWDMSTKMFQELVNDSFDEDDSNDVFPDLEIGKTLEVSFKWEKLGSTTYPEARNIVFKDREPYDESILDEVPNLDDVLHVLSYNELEAKFFEQEYVEEEGELHDIDPTPAVRVPAEERRKPVVERSETRMEDPAPRIPERKKRSFERKEAPIEKEVEKEKPQRTTRTKPITPKADCPYGHNFGVDTDEFKDCERCDVWQECMEEKEKN